MKILRNVAAPFISILAYVVVWLLGTQIAYLFSNFEFDEITYEICRRQFNPVIHFIIMAIIRAGALQFSLVVSTHVGIPLIKKFIPGTFAYALIAFCFSAFALFHIIPSLFVNTTFENVVYLIEELLKAIMSGLFIFLSFIWGDEKN